MEVDPKIIDEIKNDIANLPLDSIGDDKEFRRIVYCRAGRKTPAGNTGGNPRGNVSEKM